MDVGGLFRARMLLVANATYFVACSLKAAYLSDEAPSMLPKRMM